jgi:hypothetical protein
VNVVGGELFGGTAGLVNGICDVAGGELFGGTAGLVNGFCDVAGGCCLAVQRYWLMGFVM